MGRPSKYPRELRERAVGMVAEVRPDYPSEYAAMTAVAGMLGIGSPETIRTWIRRQQVDAWLWNRNSAAGEWRRIREEVGLPDGVTLHTLRHTFASNLIASGCDVVTVQRALGHSTPSITLNVYSHLWPSAEDKTRTATADFRALTVSARPDERVLP